MLHFIFVSLYVVCLLHCCCCYYYYYYYNVAHTVVEIVTFDVYLENLICVHIIHMESTPTEVFLCLRCKLLVFNGFPRLSFFFPVFFLCYSSQILYSFSLSLDLFTESFTFPSACKSRFTVPISIIDTTCIRCLHSYLCVDIFGRNQS